MVFADNHDMSRVYTELGQDVAKTKMAMTLFLTTRGIAQMYYGTEVLLDNTPSKDHGDIRIDFLVDLKAKLERLYRRGANKTAKSDA
ncbi:alpha-amylase family glycosyl hydrolase [Pseudoalteromonas sp. B193]